MSVQKPVYVTTKLWDELSESEQEKLNAACVQLVKIRVCASAFSILSCEISTRWQYLLLTGNVAEIVALLSSTPDLRDNLDANPYHYLLIRGDLALIEAVDEQVNLQQYPLRNNFRMSIAHYAALSGSSEVLDNVLTRHPELGDASDRNTCTVAHYAALSGSPEVLNNVLARYPELKDGKTVDGCTIAHLAALSGSPEALNNVLARYPELKDGKRIHGSTIAHLAALSGSPEALNNVLARYPELKDVKSRGGHTIAHYAAWSELPEALNNILARYPELKNVKSKKRQTIAHYAASSNSSAILIKLLLMQEPLLVAELWVKGSYFVGVHSQSLAAQILSQCLLEASKRIANRTHSAKDIDLLNVFQHQFLDLILLDEENNLPLRIYQTCLNTPGLKLCSGDRIAALLQLKEIKTKNSTLDFALIKRLLDVIENGFKLKANRWNRFFSASLSSFNLLTELNRLYQTFLQRTQIDTHDFITAVQVLIDDAKRFPILPELKQVTRLIVEKLSMTQEIMARRPQPVIQASDNISLDVKERYEAIQQKIETIKASLPSGYRSEVDAVMSAFQELIFNREAIKQHFVEQYGVEYKLHEKISLNTKVVGLGDMAAFDATLDRLVKEFLNGFDVAVRVGMAAEYFWRLTLGLCIEGRTRDVFTWISNYSEIKSIHTLMEKFYSEYQAYYKVLYNYSEDQLSELQLVVDFIMKRYENFPCLVDEAYAPDGRISKAVVMRYCIDVLGLELPKENHACTIM